jgi:MFS family permease
MTSLLQTSAPQSRARPVRLGAILAILLLAQLMAILDVNVVNVAAATIRTDLHTSGPGVQLVIAGYMIAYSVLLITGSRIGGLLGPRRVFLAGLALFTLTSLACGLAGNASTLIGFRFAQGASAAVMIPQVFSLIVRHFDGAARARAIGRYGAVIAGGVVLGQIVGGVLVSADLFGTGWRPVFFINVPIGVALLALGARVLPRDNQPAGRRLDLPGLVALGAAVLALVVPLMLGHDTGWPLWSWLSLAASVVLFAGFAAVQRRSAHPLMPGRLFRASGMLAALISLFLMMAAYGGYAFSVALHLQLGLGFSPLRAGLAFVPMAAGFAVSSLNWRRLPRAWHRWLIPGGLVLAIAGLAAITVLLRGGAAPDAWFYLAQVPFGLGSGLAYSPTVTVALASVRPEDGPDASGLVTTTVQLAQVVGLAAIGSLYLALVGPLGSGPAVAVTTALETGAAALAIVSTLRLPRLR